MSKGSFLLSDASYYGNFVAFKIFFAKGAKVDGHVLYNGVFKNTTDENKAGKAQII